MLLNTCGVPIADVVGYEADITWAECVKTVDNQIFQGTKLLYFLWNLGNCCCHGGNSIGGRRHFLYSFSSLHNFSSTTVNTTYVSFLTQNQTQKIFDSTVSLTSISWRRSVYNLVWLGGAGADGPSLCQTPPNTMSVLVCSGLVSPVHTGPTASWGKIHWIVLYSHSFTVDVIQD